MKVCYVLLTALLPSMAYGLGFRLTDQDPVATARGGAFAATADNPSAVYYNPAGITQLSGVRSLMSAYVIEYEASVDLAGPRGTHDTKYSPAVVPHSFYTLQPKNSPVTFGLGIYAPFGLGFEYDDKTPFRTLAKKGTLQYTTVSPVVAWKISDQLSIGAGPTVNYSRLKLARGIVTRGDEFIFEGDGLSVGFVAGVLWQPAPQHSVGVAYHGPAQTTYSGHTRVRIPAFEVEVAPGVTFPQPRFESEDDADLDLQFPQTIAVGYSFRPTPAWNFEVNVEWTDWDSLNVETVHQSKGPDIALPFEYESSFMYDFGVTRTFLNGMRASAGYIYSENSVPNESFNPLVPDSNRHVLSIGLGQTRGAFSWDVAYQYAYGPHRKIANGSPADGTYRFQSSALFVSLGLQF